MRNTVLNVKALAAGEIAQAGAGEALQFDAASGTIAMQYNNAPAALAPSQLVAMYLRRLQSFINDNGTPIDACVLSVPPHFPESGILALQQAAVIAGLPLVGICSDAAAAAAYYAAGHDLPEPTLVAIVDVGARYSTATVARCSNASVEVLATVTEHVGGDTLDALMLEHFAPLIKSKGGDLSQPRTLMRCLAGCQRLRHLLSTIKTSSTTIDNVCDGVDVPIAMTRDEFDALAQPVVLAIGDALRVAVGKGVQVGELLDTVELIGGCSRTPALIDAITSVVPNVSRTMDGSASIGFGAALICAMVRGDVVGRPLMADPLVSATPADIADDAQVASWREAELVMQAKDNARLASLAARDDLESRLYAFKSQIESIGASGVDTVSRAVDQALDWMYEQDDLTEPAVYSARFDEFIQSLPAEIVSAAEAHKQRELEERRAREAEAARLAEEAAAAKRDVLVRLASMKDKGNSLFKRGEFEHAAEAYITALNYLHGVELDRKAAAEAEALKLSCFVNLMLTYSRLKKWDQVVRFGGKALEIEPQHAKALFLRGSAHMASNNLDAAGADLDAAFALTPQDAAVLNARNQLAKQREDSKQRERQTYRRMFG